MLLFSWQNIAYLLFCWFLCPWWGRFLFFLLRLLFRLFCSRRGFCFLGLFGLCGLWRMSWIIPLTFFPLLPLWALVLFLGRFGFWSRWACFLLDFLFPSRFERLFLRLFLVLISALVRDGFRRMERKIFLRLVPRVSRWCKCLVSICSSPVIWKITSNIFTGAQTFGFLPQFHNYCVKNRLCYLLLFLCNDEDVCNSEWISEVGSELDSWRCCIDEHPLCWIWPRNIRNTD